MSHRGSNGNDLDAQIGARVAWARARRGLSQTDLGRPLGLHASAVSMKEAGHRKVSVTELLHFASALQVDPTWLLVGEGEEMAGRVGHKETHAALKGELRTAAQTWLSAEGVYLEAQLRLGAAERGLKALVNQTLPEPDVEDIWSVIAREDGSYDIHFRRRHTFRGAQRLHVDPPPPAEEEDADGQRAV